jgi:mannose-6-phosphate isomerase
LKIELKKRAETARAWMFEAAFPLWAKNGLDPRNGFCEVLDLSGSPVIAPTSRVRVQARQTYSFALAKSLGWDEACSSELVAYGVETLTGHCLRDDGLYGRTMSQTGGMVDDTAELYDTAFALLAFAWAAGAGIDKAHEAGGNVSRAIESKLMRPVVQGGYAETLPVPTDRNQNPHMHLLEASLAESAFLGRDMAAGRIRMISQLMQQRFRTSTGALRERFSANWGVHPDDHFEVGHQYEWVWLLHQIKGENRVEARKLADRLYAHALALTGPNGELFLEHTRDGHVRDGRQRCWGATEALKAHLARHEAGDDGAGIAAVVCFDRLWALHIEGAVEGGWLDCRRMTGELLSTDIPASTGYHIFLAFAELMRVANLKIV